MQMTRQVTPAGPTTKAKTIQEMIPIGAKAKASPGRASLTESPRTTATQKAKARTKERKEKRVRRKAHLTKPMLKKENSRRRKSLLPNHRPPKLGPPRMAKPGLKSMASGI